VTRVGSAALVDETFPRLSCASCSAWALNPLSAHRIKRLPIKGLYAQALPFEQYVTLMQQKAHSDGHRSRLSYRSFRQSSLWN
jgi:hypothetical protein